MTLDWSGIATGATPVLLTACFALVALLYRRMCNVLKAPRADVVTLQKAVTDLAALVVATNRRLDEQERVNAQRHQENREDLRDLRGAMHDAEGR